MATTFDKTLVIGISATALFDLSEADTLFQEEFTKDPHKGMEKYKKYMLENEDLPLEEGIGFPLPARTTAHVYRLQPR